MPTLEISTAFRASLRSAAHALKPLVLIGDKGLTEAVLKEINRCLDQHGLIKVRAGGEDKESRTAILDQICAELNCAPVHHLGKIFTLYRPTEDDPDATHLLAFNKKSKKDPFGQIVRKANDPHIPKKLAAVGKLEAPKRKPRSTEEETQTNHRTVRSYYLGDNERPKRPSLHRDTGSQRGEARVEKEREARRESRRISSLASRDAASASPKDRRANSAASPRKRSALSLRAGVKRER